jgi:hypothetical protein
MGKGRAYSRDQARKMFLLSRKKHWISTVGRKKDRAYWAEKKGQSLPADLLARRKKIQMRKKSQYRER